MDDLADLLTTRLEALRGGDVVVDDLRRLTGGASRETWSFRVGEERLILQRQRPGGTLDKRMGMEASLLRAATASGVPVPALLDSAEDPDILGTPYLLSAFVDGETIARKILRDDPYDDARASLAADCGRALAGIHAIPISEVEGIVETDQLTQYREILDSFGEAIPTFELAFRWLAEHRPAGTDRTVVHGDFRLGNLMVGPDGLRAVVDWELAHIGDPMEDLGWLCVRAWRFGGSGPVAGVGAYDELFGAYEQASGRTVDPAVVRWWEVLGTLKWGIICVMQSRAHLDGWTRSMELAAIGRRVCENEHDLLLLLAPDALAEARRAADGANVEVPAIHGRPTAAELVEAVREWVVDHVRPQAQGPVAFHSRVAENVLRTVERELRSGPAIDAAQRDRYQRLDVGSEADIARQVREGSLAIDDPTLLEVVSATVVDKVRIANPKWLPPAD